MSPCLVLEVSVVGVAPDAVEDEVVFAVAVDLEHAVLNVPYSMNTNGLSEKKSTGFSSEIGTKLRDWAVGQDGGQTSALHTANPVDYTLLLLKTGKVHHKQA